MIRRLKQTFAGIVVLQLVTGCAPLLRELPQQTPAAPEPPASSNTQWEPGADLRVYYIGAPLAKIPELLESQTPNYNVKISRLDLDGERGDFGENGEQFYTTITGRLRAQTAGSYRFQLTSDDGSQLFLGGKKVLDHDGLHGATSVDTSIELAAGYHDLELRHFENLGGDVLRLEWQPPGATEFAVVTDSHVETPAGWVRVTSPGKKKVRGPKDPAGDGRPLTQLHPGYDVYPARPPGFEPRVGGIDFFPDGKMVICCWDADGSVYTIDRFRDGVPEEIEVKRIAAGLAEPLGICVVDERIFVLQKQELTELIDRDKDGNYEEYACVNADWSVTSNFHEFAFGLIHLDGWLYFNLAIAIDPGGKSTKPQVPDRGRTARVNIETGELEFLTRGLRTPNGIGVCRDGSIYVTDNQGDWLPSSKVVHVQPGAFYNSRAALPDDWVEQPVSPPVAWMPQNEIGNSPGEVVEFHNGPFTGQLAVSDVTHGGIKRIAIEEIDDMRQGALFRFTQGLEAGVNRLKLLEDGTFIVGGIGSGGNWGQEGKLKYGLQQVVPNGVKTFEMRRLAIQSNGFVIEFTEPVDAGTIPAPADFPVELFRYIPTEEYGGPKHDLKQLTASSVSLDSKGRRLFLEIEGLEEDRVCYLRLPGQLRSRRHRALWSTEVWYTINRVPKDKKHAGFAESPAPRRHNQLSRRETADNWTLLFDGTSTDAWRGYKQDGFPTKGWSAVDGCLTHAAGGGGGDLITRERYENFDFQCEWRVAPGGNSGIIYLVNEGDGASYMTGPEMQVLDNYRWQPSPDTAAGALYDLVPCRRDVCRPAGEWNHARVRIENRRIQHWLNGVLVVDVVLYSDDWNKRLAASKFRDWPDFAKVPSGHIALQDHGDEVSYRSLKIRRLPASEKPK